MCEPEEILKKQYYINVGKKGTFTPGKDPKFNTSPQEIDELFEILKSNGTTKILLYFHGGLVNAQSGLNTAKRIKNHVKVGSDSHPISFVWQTDFKTTILQNLDTISNSKFFKKLLIKVIKIGGGKLGLEHIKELGTSKGIGSLSEKEIELELKNNSPFENYKTDEGAKSVSVISIEKNIENTKALERELEAEIEEEIQGDPKFLEIAESEKSSKELELLSPNLSEGHEEGSKGIFSAIKLIKAVVKVTINVIKRHIKKRNHDFYPTVVEEILREFYVSDIGNWVWGNMKEKATDMWKDHDFQGKNTNWPVGSYFLKKLEEYQKNNPETVYVDLIGHSAGSIVICEMLKKTKRIKSEVKFRNIIFLAPACLCELFKEGIIENKSKFNLFRSFTMMDRYEKQDRMLNFIYPRSLLYLISGILENESDAYIFGLQRHIEGNPPYNEKLLLEIKDFISKDGDVVYSVTDDNAKEGYITKSRTHGGFDDDISTLNSIIKLINL